METDGDTHQVAAGCRFESVLFFHSRLEVASMKRNSRNIFRDSSTALGDKG